MCERIIEPHAIDLKNVSFSYEKTPILEDISFSLKQVDFLGIIGPNGGGKTTLNEEFTFIAGTPVSLMYFALLGMTTRCVVMVIKVVGLILVIALLTIPPYITEKYIRSLGEMMALSLFLGIFFTSSGLWLSYSCDITSGTTIVIVAGVAFFVSQALDMIKKRYAGHGRNSNVCFISTALALTLNSQQEPVISIW